MCYFSIPSPPKHTNSKQVAKHLEISSLGDLYTRRKTEALFTFGKILILLLHDLAVGMGFKEERKAEKGTCLKGGRNKIFLSQTVKITEMCRTNVIMELSLVSFFLSFFFFRCGFTIIYSLHKKLWIYHLIKWKTWFFNILS